MVNLRGVRFWPQGTQFHQTETDRFRKAAEKKSETNCRHYAQVPRRKKRKIAAGGLFSPRVFREWKRRATLKNLIDRRDRQNGAAAILDFPDIFFFKTKWNKSEDSSFFSFSGEQKVLLDRGEVQDSDFPHENRKKERKRKSEKKQAPDSLPENFSTFPGFFKKNLLTYFPLLNEV